MLYGYDGLTPDNPTCADLGLGTLTSKKVDPPTPGTYPLDANFDVTWSFTSGNQILTWSSEISIDAVIVKGGNGANVYIYNPESLGDSGLMSPDNASGGAAGLSHLDFCFDYEVRVQKTAVTSLSRTWAWAIDKTSALGTLLLSAGQIYQMPYTVKVTRTGSTDSAWAVAGVITVSNPHPTIDATVTGVSDQISGLADATSVNCGATTFPATLAPGASFQCTYSQALPDGSDRVNTATATATGVVGTGTGTAAVAFSGAAVSHVDECVTVTDSLHGALGEVCSNEASHTFEYLHNIGPFASCTQHTVDNTATFTACDSGATGSDTASVGVTVACTAGCTLTQGYWKTHSINGPAPYDDTWANHEGDHFFLSGMSYYQVLWTPPAGNAYFTLAHQYIAAWLNGLNGADTTAASTAFNAATALLQANTPSQVGVLKANNTLRKQFVSLAGVLASFNEGSIGPGHCSE